MDKEQKKKAIAQKKVFIAVKTTSVNKLEKMITENPNHKHRSVIALFVFFNQNGKLNPLKHPNLIKLADQFRKAVEKASKKDPFYETYLKMENAFEYKRRSNEFKHDVSIMIKESLVETNTSINALAEKSGIRYSNLYNFLEKEKYSDISVRNTHKLYMISRSLKEGWNSKEEAISGMMDKWEKLKEYLEEKEKEND